MTHPWFVPYSSNFLRRIPVDRGRKLNVHKTFRRHPGRLLDALSTFNLRPVSIGMEQSTLSKAFDRSMNTPSVYLLFSKDSIIWSTNYTTVWPVEWPFRKQNCLEYKILFSINYLYKRLYIMHSSILEKHGNIDIGLELLTSLLSSPL